MAPLITHIIYDNDGLLLDTEPFYTTAHEIVAARYGKEPSSAPPDLLAAARAYPWPGNVRELANAIERATVLCRGDRIDVSGFPFAGGPPREDVAASHGLRLRPDSLHDLGRPLRRVVLDQDVQVGIADHVEEHAEDGMVALVRQMRREIRGPEEHVDQRRPKVAEILSVNEEQVDAERRWLLLQRIRERDEQSHTRCAVIGSVDGEHLFGGIELVVRGGASIPVREVQHALGRRGIESGQDVSQREFASGLRRVRPRLLHHGRAAGLHLAGDPVAGLAMRLGPGDSRPERDLRAGENHSFNVLVRFAF